MQTTNVNFGCSEVKIPFTCDPISSVISLLIKTITHAKFDEDTLIYPIVS